MLRIKLEDLEYEIEDVKLSYEIFKHTGIQCGFFGKDEVCYSENRILDLTDDLSDILNYLKMALQLLKKRKVLSKTHASIFLGK